MSLISNRPVGASVGLGDGKSAITNQPVGKLLGVGQSGSSITNQPVGASVGLGVSGSSITNLPVGTTAGLAPVVSQITNQPVGATIGLGGNATRVFGPPPPPQASTAGPGSLSEHQHADESGPPPPPVSPFSSQSFNDIVDQWIHPNVLNQYWQPTYHFRLFMAGDKDLLDNAGASSNITQLLRKVNGSDLNQVVIAESGVTGYNIKDVEIRTVDSLNGRTREQKGTEFTMTVTEPLGISFLDGLAGAGTLLNVWDYTKTIYFLRLSFTGYKEDGSFAGNPLNFTDATGGVNYANGGQWLWALKLTLIETKINEGGGVYTLHFVTTESEPVLLEDKAMKANQAVHPEGATLRDLFNDYADKMTKAWKDNYGKDNNNKTIVSFKIVTHPILFEPNKGKDPGDFKLDPQKRELGNIRSLAMEAKHGRQTVTVPPGMGINDFITAAILSTEEGQALFKDEPVQNQPDISSTQTNSKQYRVSKLFSIESDIKTTDFEKETGNYVKEITLHVTPTYYQGAILSRAQVDDAASAAVQRQMVQDLGDNGFLRKRYEYIFTGLNTEVLDFNIAFNMAWQAPLPKAAGNRMGYLNVADHARKAPVEQTQPSDTLHPVPLKDSAGASGAGGSPANAPQQANAVQVVSHFAPLGAAATALEAARGGLHQATALPSMTNSAENLPQQANAFRPAPVQVPAESSGGTIYYIEDVLTRLNQGQLNVLPISFRKDWLNVEKESGTGVNSQYHVDRPLAAAVLVQKLTSDFQTIDLTVRGDPYWLGQSNLERQLIFRNSGPTHDRSALPSFTTGSPNFILYFRFPIQLGDDFKPILKDSAAFNGIYQVTEVKHTFSEGAFKQVLTAVRSPLMDVARVFTTDPNERSNGPASGPNLQSSNKPGSGSTPGSGSGNPSDPRGIRNNNPTNLTYVSGQPGVNGSDGRFGTYGTMEDGIGAAQNQLLINQNSHGADTVSKQITRWAPPGENNTTSYINTVSSQLGVGPHDKIDVSNPQTAQVLLAAQIKVETGRSLDSSVVATGVSKGNTYYASTH